MARYVLRVFRDNVTGWVPTILVVAVVTTLVGICMNQFVWTSSPSFTLAARQAGLDPAEFGMVSVTIYVVVSLLAFFSLTVVGSATVNRIHGTFAQWRLMGASPSQVLASMWMLVGVASLFGSLIGSLAAVPASLLAVPEFNAMAAESFADGFGSFAPPAFTPSMAAWLGSLLLGVATCMLGASIPSLRAAKIRPIEVIRGTGAIGIRHGWRSWAHWALGLIVMAAALALAFSGMGTPRTLAFGQEAGQTFNSALWAGIIASFGMYILVSMLIPILLDIGRVVRRLCGSATGVLAARSAKAKAASNTNTIAPLALAMGLSVTLLTCARSYGRILALGGHPKSLNYADSLLLITMLCIVSLATSMAVIALSNRSMVADQALLRSIGLSPRRVIRMYLWQSLQLAAGAVILSLIPVAVSASVFAAKSAALVGIPVAEIPWAGRNRHGHGLLAGIVPHPVHADSPRATPQRGRHDTHMLTCTQHHTKRATMGAMKPQSAQANKVTVLAVPLVIAVVECAAMLWEHAIGAPADTMYTFAKDPLGLALLLAMTIASSAILLVRYWLPAVALALEAVLLIVASYWRLDSIVMIQTLVACYAFARTARGRGLCVGGIGMMLSMTASAIMVHPDVLATEWVSRVVTLAAVGGGALAVRGRQQAKEAEHKAAEECRRAAELAFQRDAAIRRSRIAGQLHDSVGQGLTVIIALSEGLAGKTDDPRVEDALHGINEIARESLGDTRKAVRALTEFDGAANGDDTHTQESDQHSWDDIRPILAHARRLGIVTVFTETGTRADDEAQADLCFDVTREAITNAIRHGQNVVHISIAWNHSENGTVAVIIRNDGSPARKDARKDDGTGLVRLFHRVESASGIFEYGPNEDGEWVVEATIPSNGVNEKDHTA